MSKVVAIHQPNFFPWLGYFDKICRSDVFVFLDSVQFQKTGGSWTNRVKLIVAGEPKWLTATVDRDYHGTRDISEMSFRLQDHWKEKSIRSIQLNYSKHPFYAEVCNLIEPLLLNPEENVAAYNIHAITSIAQILGVDSAKFRRSSELGCGESSNELLCAITKAVGGDVYMCGGGADGYQDEEIFRKTGVILRRQSFRHPEYPQFRRGDFVPGLSIIDAAMNLGWVALGKKLREA